MKSRRVSACLGVIVLGAAASWFAHSANAQLPPPEIDPLPAGEALPIPASPPSVPKAPGHSSPGNPSPAANVQPGEQVMQIVSPQTKINFRNLDTRVLELANRIKVVDGFDQDKITVKALSPHRVRVRAESPGVTSLKLIDEFDNIHGIEVFVEPDTRELEAYLQRLFPASAIEVVGIRDGVVLRGWVTEPAQIPQIMAIAEQFYEIVHPQLTVAGPSQVQLHVKVMEVQRSKLRQLGINFELSGSSFLFGSSIGQLLPLESEFQLSVFGNDVQFDGFIKALVTESLAKILAEPVLVTTSGRPASMLSGGKFPFPVPQSFGTNTIQWERYGVSLEAVPIVLGQGRLRLDVAPEVSEQDFSRAAVVNGQTVPALSLRSVNTQVEMRFGETLMIGGLISSRRVANVRKVPVLGEIPVAGAFFSTKRYEMSETELVILVTPQMVSPMTPCQVPQGGPGLQSTDPIDRELYLDGNLEVPRFGPDCPDCQPDAGLVIPGGPVPAGPSCEPTPNYPPLLGAKGTPKTEVQPASATPPTQSGSRTTIVNPFHSVSKSGTVAPPKEKPAAPKASSSGIQQASGTIESTDPNSKPRTAIFESRSLPGLIQPK
ncbi:type II and III secretion system protein family protein [Planctomicrobium sp. SH661]|uniref:type II and III secretion system protein family protein n=1 Tax=Planctomicrobium sp. SH661 TaxID=3448124 RepID=UPI003F5C7478